MCMSPSAALVHVCMHGMSLQQGGHEMMVSQPGGRVWMLQQGTQLRRLLLWMQEDAAKTNLFACFEHVDDHMHISLPIALP